MDVESGMMIPLKVPYFVLTVLGDCNSSCISYPSNNDSLINVSVNDARIITWEIIDNKQIIDLIYERTLIFEDDLSNLTLIEQANLTFDQQIDFTIWWHNDTTC